ncbi:hypothetical protein [Spiroplasma alleghenense]|uniref:Uncharacterized protein n=1 Tax=Spiroplasma alleghenense TaxID=216931 RepID=A0A345Z3F0_9MOLU|nr:hypothetical protein [Spiroplasma alleghenense]AXK51129.1 hypothetical protein SALLE_v1c04550 [Spiroplasma alleghenense]
MINFAKPDNLTKNEADKLVHLIPYWEKAGILVSKKLNKWLIKFASEGKGYLKTIDINGDVTEQIFYNAINFANFYNIKINKIKANPKILKKFSKMIVQTTELMAICQAIKIITEFYSIIEKETVSEKRNLAISLLNDKNFKIFEQSKSEIMSQIGDDEYLDITFKEAAMFDGRIFESKNITFKVLSYLRLLSKKKKISESVLMNCNYSLFFSENFSWYLKKYLNNFIINIY